MQRKRNQPRFFYAKLLYLWAWFALYLLILTALAELTKELLYG